MINETVNNLTQAICTQWTKDGDRTTGPGSGRVRTGGVRGYSVVLRAERASSCSATEATTQLAGDLERRAAPPCRTGVGVGEKRAGGVVPLPGANGDSRAGGRPRLPAPIRSKNSVTGSPSRDFTRIAQMRVNRAGDPWSRGPAGQRGMAPDELGDRRRACREHPRLRPENPGRGRQPPAETRHGRSGSQP